MGGTDGGTPGADGRYSVPQVARILGLSERAVRKRIEAGTLDGVRQGEGPWRVALVLGAAPVGGTGGGTAGGTGAVSAASVAEPVEASPQVTPAAIERAVLRTSAQYMGDLRTVLAEVGQVYAGQLAAQRETIAELRRRAEAAETEREALRDELGRLRGAPAMAVPPGAAVMPAAAAGDVPSAAGLWQRLRRLLPGVAGA